MLKITDRELDFVLYDLPNYGMQGWGVGMRDLQIAHYSIHGGRCDGLDMRNLRNSRVGDAEITNIRPILFSDGHH
ncbi:hypothetical protein EYC80_008073 [Monilinia laxa]|uniref:Uncharacterized protein n=1 Tax=Monilinia laxa TaxID=61186 RepID=A0A5N6JVF8_MONLA|nr:hypothetical protein EYC80_008073 [Monilinia laxa]